MYIYYLDAWLLLSTTRTHSHMCSHKRIHGTNLLINYIQYDILLWYFGKRNSSIIYCVLMSLLWYKLFDWANAHNGVSAHVYPTSPVIWRVCIINAPIWLMVGGGGAFITNAVRSHPPRTQLRAQQVGFVPPLGPPTAREYVHLSQFWYACARGDPRRVQVAERGASNGPVLCVLCLSHNLRLTVQHPSLTVLVVVVVVEVVIVEIVEVAAS